MSVVNPVQARKRARMRALQALYQHQLNPQTSAELISQFHETQDMDRTDLAYFALLLKEIIAGTKQLDEILSPYLEIPIKQLDITEHCILRMAIYELSRHPEIPMAVVIDEAVSLAKKFGATDGHKFVNGVLDRAGKDLRPQG